MNFELTEFPGLIVIKPKIFKDERGNFFETYNKKEFEEILNKQFKCTNEPIEFVQDNQSISNKGVLRGMHYQVSPFEQAKLVRVVKGSVRDVVVDIRKYSDLGIRDTGILNSNLVNLAKRSYEPKANKSQILNPMYGKYFSIILSEENNVMLWVPPGFAHGFLTLKDNTIFIYKCTQFYNKDSERAILWNDPDINIDWNIDEAILSEKDKKASKFASLQIC